MDEFLLEHSINKITLSGEIISIDRVSSEVRIFRQGMEVQMRCKNTAGEEILGRIKVIVINERELTQKFKKGDRILFTGELKRTVFDQIYVDLSIEKVEQAVRNYQKYYKEDPVFHRASKSRKISPRGEIIDMKRLYDTGFLLNVPHRSYYDRFNQRKRNTDEVQLTYKLKEGKVILAAELYSFDVICKPENIRVIEPLKEGQLDVNRAVIRGQVKSISNSRKRIAANKVTTGIFVETASTIFNEKHVWKVSVLVEDSLSLKNFKKFELDDYIYVSGECSFRAYSDSFSLSTQTESGNRKKKSFTISYLDVKILAKHLNGVVDGQTKEAKPL